MKKLLLALCLLLVCADSDAQLTYPDVAGIFYARCGSCHHDNGGAPFSLLNYSETAANIGGIESTLLSGEMPPWPADTTYRRFINEHTISQTDKDAILNWISSGAAMGDTSLAPPAPVYPAHKLGGTPDMILTIPTFTSNATASDDAYDVFSLPTGLSSTRIIRAIEVVPGNTGIVHHVVVMGDNTGTVASDLSGTAYTIPGNIGIGSYQPGAEPILFPGTAPAKMGINLPAGSNIVLQIHYPAGSGGQQDSTQVRIYFYPPGTTGVRQVYIMVPLQYWKTDFWLLGGQVKTFQVDTAEYDTFPLSIIGSIPHAHQICTHVLNYAYQGTDTIPLNRINDWEFHHQYYYYYPHPVKIPPGYRYHGTHVYDNQASNPNNPFSPPQLITGGVNTTDEMFFDAFQWLVYQPGDENINMDSLLSNDSLVLLNVPGYETSALNPGSFSYPNPFNDHTTIRFNDLHYPPQQCTLQVFDGYGRTVHPGYTWDNMELKLEGSSLASGLYYYRLIDPAHRVYSGKLILQ